MGQEQYKASEGMEKDGEGSPHNLHELKDRVSAKFQQRAPMVVNPGATGDGAKSNPGRPV